MKSSKTIIALSLLLIPLIPQTNSYPLLASKSKVKSASSHPSKTFSLTNPFELNITAKAVYILDLDSNSVIFQKNSSRPLYPASLTKIVTALVALDAFELDQIQTVKSAEHSLGNNMNLIAGDKLTTKDLLYGLLVSSGNDAGLTLAENYPGGYTQFIIAMNKKVASLGLRTTHFNNVSGVEDPDHVTTAREISKLAQTALRNSTFRQIVATDQITIESVNGHRYQLYSTNQLLDSLPQVQGVKTGWTPAAGECLITLINLHGHSLLITLLGSEDRFAETRQIINWIQENVVWK